MEDTFIRNIDGSFSKAVVGSGHTVVGCTLPLNDGLSIEVGEAEPTTITETTPETSRWIGRDVYELIRACDEALNWADANARWFDISTAPNDGTLVMFHVPSRTNPLIGRADDYWAGAYWLADVTHWAPLPPPPSNPPLPEPIEALGAVLRKIKGA